MSAPERVSAFELFGFKFFGSAEESDAEIIDPVAYAATLVADNDDRKLLDKLSDASLLIRKQSQPPSGTIGLIARARDDRANLLGLLYEEAFYGATVSIVIAGRPLEQIDVTDTLKPVAKKVPVTITVIPGAEFRFGAVLVDGADTAIVRAAIEKTGLKTGNRASSRTILEAEAELVRAWQREGHPFAKITDRQVVADHATRRLDVTLQVESGRAARLGQVSVRGTTKVAPEFLQRQAQVPVGEAYSPEALEQARRNLAKLDALASTSVTVGDKIDAQGNVPVIIEVSDRKPRTIGAGALYDSTEGLTVQGFWLHRNLFGEAETVRVDASIGRLIEANELDEYDALFSVLYSVPGFLHPRNRLDLKATLIQEDPDPYNRRGIVFESRLVHELSDQLRISGGAVFDWARIDDAFGRNFYTLVALPGIVTYDARNSVLDPTSGLFAQLRLEPQLETSSTSLFFTADAELRYYFALDDEARHVIAARGLAGTTAGASLVEIPAHRRFYAGGGGSVRGYDYLNVGPRVTGFGATGGLSRIEGSLEARLRVTDTIGIVPFVDAGLVTSETVFGGVDDFQVGVGVGLRYYTSVGPLRLDVAVPLDPRSGDPSFAIYAGIGQSF
ncbi:MAG: outer membrane protein assembly factor [Rhizobiales bacterium]|nr:outer membrane protein assembly factor [Hyphomicrobiales bacterium]